MRIASDRPRRIGVPVPMLGAREKASGQAKYVGDLVFPRMLHGKVLRSPHPHARVLSIDASKALRVPGVRAVLTGRDIPPVRWGMIKKDQTMLAIDRVRYVGEEVALILARDREAALDALGEVQVEYEVLPAVFDPLEAMREGAPLIHPDARNIAQTFLIDRGDVEEGFRRADVILEETYQTSIQYQAYMEPMGAAAEPAPGGRVTVYAPVQGIFYARERISDALGVSTSQVRVIQSTVGGAFGGKHMDDPIPMLAAFGVLKTGHPVRLLNERTEEFSAGRPRVAARTRLKVGVTREGLITAKEAEVIGDNGAYTCKAPPILAQTAMRMDNLYRIRNIRTRAHLVYTNKIPTSAFRGFGTPQGAFALESHLDALAEAIGMDPAELRLRNVVEPGDVTAHGWKIGSCGIRQCIEETVGRSGFRNRRRGSSTLRRGLGLACAIHVSGNRHFANWDGAAAIVKFNEDGRVNLICGEGDVGQGSLTVLAQIAAEELGLPLEAICVSTADTDTTPFCFGSFASRVTLIAGNAVRGAAADARAQLLRAAAEQLESRPEDLTLEDGFIFPQGAPERCLSVSQVLRAALFRHGGENIIGKASYDAPSEVADFVTRFGNIAPGYEFAAQVVEVEVDTETGAVSVLKVYAADDLGRTINPLTAEGQVQGGVVQGLGYALSEELLLEGGQVINGNFGDYKLPRSEGSPPIESILVESVDPNGPFGAKGVSEACINPTAPAVANAIYDAVGVRIPSLPITAEKVLKALRERAGSDR